MIRVRAAVFSLVLASTGLAACGGAGSSLTKSDLMSPNVVAISPPRPLSPVQTAVFKRGEEVIDASAGWPATRSTNYGNNGPGPPLSHIGSMLSSRAIASRYVIQPLLCRPLPALRRATRSSSRTWLYSSQRCDSGLCAESDAANSSVVNDELPQLAQRRRHSRSGLGHGSGADSAQRAARTPL